MAKCSVKGVGRLALLACAELSAAVAQVSPERERRYLASVILEIGVYITGYCTALGKGPVFQGLILKFMSAGGTLEDLTADRVLPVVERMKGVYGSKPKSVACRDALEKYGPEGTVVPNAISTQ